MAWQDGRHSRPQRYPGMSSGEPSATSLWTACLFSSPIEGAGQCLLVHNDVRADDGNLYILRQRTSSPDGAWDLDSFRQEKPR